MNEDKIIDKSQTNRLRGMTEEEYKKFLQFLKDGNKHLEENEVTECKPWTDSFAYMIQLFRIITEDWDFSEPFRIVIDYDPEQPRTVIHKYSPKSSAECEPDDSNQGGKR